MFDNRDVRWALALLIDIKAVALASYRGAATISAIGLPPTGAHPKTITSRWSRGCGTSSSIPASARSSRTIRPSASRSPTWCGPRSAIRSRPIPAAIAQRVRLRLVEAQSAGGGRTAGERRLHQARRAAGSCRTASRSRSAIMVEGELRPAMTRAGSMIAQQWRQFGIDATTAVAQGTLNDRRGAGDFEAMIAWSVETWGGHPDLSFFLDSWHSRLRGQPGETQAPRNWQRWSNARAGQDHRADPHRSLRRSEGHRVRARLPEARRAGDADDPAHVLQCVHRHG